MKTTYLLILNLFYFSLNSCTSPTNPTPTTEREPTETQPPAGLLSTDYFQITFPDTFQQRSDSAQTELGSFISHSYYHQTTDSVVFMLSYNDYPTNWQPLLNSETLITDKKNALIQASQIPHSEQGENWVKGSNDNNYWHHQLHFHQNRLYQIAILAPIDHKPTAEQEQSFLGSFEMKD